MHLWAGLGLGIFFLMMGLSGSVMAWKQELLRWEARQLAPVQPVGERAPLEVVVAEARRALPYLRDEDLAGVYLDTDPRTPYLFVYGDFVNHPNDVHMLLMDPYTAQVRRVIMMRHTVSGFVQILHTSLFLAARGTLLSGMGAVGLVSLLLSGLWLWWPSTRGQLRSRLTVQRGASRSRLLYDWHNLLGIYLWPVLLTVTLTAAAMALDGPLHIREVISHLTGSPKKLPPPKVRVSGSPHRLLEAVRSAEGVAGTPRYLFRPLKPDQPAALHTCIRRFGLFQNAVAYLDPYSGRVLRVEEEQNDAPSGKVIVAIRTLHYGTAGGWVTQALYTVAGLLPLGLFVTGVLKWVEHRRKPTQSRNRRKTRAVEVDGNGGEAAGAP